MTVNEADKKSYASPVFDVKKFLPSESYLLSGIGNIIPDGGDNEIEAP